MSTPINDSQRQYGWLQCLSSMALLFRIYTVCVPGTASMVVRCGAIASFKLPLQPLVRPWQSPTNTFSGTSLDLRSSTAVSILLPELGLMCLPDQWLLRAATFWNACSPATWLFTQAYGSLCMRLGL